MDKEIAKTLISLAVSMDHAIGTMLSEVENISDPELKARFKKTVGDLLKQVTLGLIFPIVDEYPDLDPDK